MPGAVRVDADRQSQSLPIIEGRSKNRNFRMETLLDTEHVFCISFHRCKTLQVIMQLVWLGNMVWLLWLHFHSALLCSSASRPVHQVLDVFRVKAIVFDSELHSRIISVHWCGRTYSLGAVGSRCRVVAEFRATRTGRNSLTIASKLTPAPGVTNRGPGIGLEWREFTGQDKSVIITASPA